MLIFLPLLPAMMRYVAICHVFDRNQPNGRANHDKAV